MVKNQILIFKIIIFNSILMKILLKFKLAGDNLFLPNATCQF